MRQANYRFHLSRQGRTQVGDCGGATLSARKNEFMTLERVSYTLDSTLDSVNKAEQTAEELAAKMPFDDEDCHRIAMAMREAAVNAVLHGNAYDPKKKMTVSIKNTGEALVQKIVDQRRGISHED